MKMDYDLCRFCLSKDNLKLIFNNLEQNEPFSSTFLALATGLNIEPNDGLPQKICRECSELVNHACKLRNQAQESDSKLLQLGFQRNTELKDPVIDQNIDLLLPNTSPIDCFNTIDPNTFKIEVELDRISDIEDVYEEKEKKEAKEPNSIQPIKNNTRKEKRELYLSLVEGDFNEKGPVKCRVCKKTVSKWACFINHAKKHLGFKFVCEFCGKSFISSNQLKRHCRSYHGMQRELKCKHCDYLALDNAQLLVHERRVHTGVRPYVCDVCGASYFSRKCLVQHIEAHRTTADIQCSLCPARFKSRRHLAKHRYGAHSDKRRARRRERRLKDADTST